MAESGTSTLVKVGAGIGVGYVVMRGIAADNAPLGKGLQALAKGILGVASGTKAVVDAASTAAGNSAAGGSGPVAAPAPAPAYAASLTGADRVTVSGGQVFARAKDLATYDPAVRGFAWDGVAVYLIEQGTGIGFATDSPTALAVARRWAERNL